MEPISVSTAAIGGTAIAVGAFVIGFICGRPGAEDRKILEANKAAAPPPAPAAPAAAAPAKP